MRCDEIELLIEAIADGSLQPDAQVATHLAACEACAARLEKARAIDQLLAMREMPSPPAAFTQVVMARVSRERWKAERAIDLGFNLAIAAGIMVIVAGGAGLAWSLGFLSVTIDIGAIWEAIGTDAAGHVLSQVQTIAMSAVLLTMALVLWWWAEAASD